MTTGNGGISPTPGFPIAEVQGYWAEDTFDEVPVFVMQICSKGNDSERWLTCFLSQPVAQELYRLLTGENTALS